MLVLVLLHLEKILLPQPILSLRLQSLNAIDAPLLIGRRRNIAAFVAAFEHS